MTNPAIKLTRICLASLDAKPYTLAAPVISLLKDTPVEAVYEVDLSVFNFL